MGVSCLFVDSKFALFKYIGVFCVVVFIRCAFFCSGSSFHSWRILFAEMFPGVFSFFFRPGGSLFVYYNCFMVYFMSSGFFSAVADYAKLRASLALEASAVKPMDGFSLTSSGGELSWFWLGRSGG